MRIAELPRDPQRRARVARTHPLNLLFASDRLLSRAVRTVIDAIMATVPKQARQAVKGVAR
jgi:hypothetical protein